jgi:hypothetical protein
MRVLLTDGSGLTARQTAGLLGAAGHHVEVLSPDPWCLCRFTRHVRGVRPVTAYGADPVRWLDAALAAYLDGGFDVLFPTQEQVAVLAAFPDRLRTAGVRSAVPSFASVAAVQDKVSAWRTLTALGIPQPAASTDLEHWQDFPAFVKQPIGTASGGVRRVVDNTGLRRDGDAGVVLVQAAATGPLAMCQCVFDHGRLVAFHANLRVVEGANGGASHKRSITLPAAREQLARIGTALDWHGALSADVIVSADGPLVIDLNPRLVEPVSAARSGVDLTGTMLALATGEAAPPQPETTAGVASHQLILALLGAASRGKGRRGVARELARAARHRGAYRDSHEELTPLRGDAASALALLRVATTVLARPGAWRGLATGSVASYAISVAGWEQLRSAAVVAAAMGQPESGQPPLG